jgi:hypothetical protein
MEENKPTEVEKAAIEFLKSFTEVFGNDWSYTKSMLGIVDDPEKDQEAAALIGSIFGEANPEVRYAVSPDGTFIDPKVEDVTEDWGNRAQLLEAYNRLKKLLAVRGLCEQSS